MVFLIFNAAGLGIHFVMTWALFSPYLECLGHCIKFDSWEKCTNRDVKTNLQGSAFYGLSGYLWVLGNCREFHILCLWLLVTAQLIGITIAFLVYAQRLVGYPLGLDELVYTGFLISSFLLVLMHCLVAKNIIKNRWIKRFFTFCISLTGKVG